MRHVFLHHQSSTPVLPAVFDAMKPFFTEACGWTVRAVSAQDFLSRPNPA